MKKKIFSLGLTALLFAFFYNVNAGDLNNPYKSTIKNTESPDVATRVYFSNEIPIAGIAKEGKEFNIDPSKGSFLYMIIDNYPNNFTYNQVRVYIYKKVNGTSQKYDEKTYDISTNLYYTYIKYSFYSEGNYIFDVFDKNMGFVGTAEVTIYYTGSASTDAAAKISGSTSTNTSTDPYSKSKVYFSTETPVFGIAKNVTTFNINRKGGFVYVVVDNYPTNFNVSSLKLYVYKKIKGNYVTHDEAIYDINANNYFTYFKYSFYSEGDYKFVVYDGLNKYVNTGYVEIK